MSRKDVRDVESKDKNDMVSLKSEIKFGFFESKVFSSGPIGVTGIHTDVEAVRLFPLSYSA